MIPPREREEMYQVFEQLGNMRIDRLGFALSMDDQGRVQRIFLRFSGAGDRQRLASMLKMTGPKFEPSDEKGPKGEPITLLSSQTSPPAFAIIGDNEVIVAGYEKDQGNHLEVVKQALAVRAGKEKGVPDGALARLVGQAPDAARGVLAIDLNEGMRRDFLRGRPPISVAPQRVLAHIVRGGEGDATKPGLTIGGQASFSDADEAKKAVKELEDVKQKALKELDDAPKNRGIPPQALKAAKEMLSAVKLDTNGATAQARLSLSSEKVLTEMLRWFLEARPAAPPDPLPKPDRLPPPDKP
jgi:hypothetical protein